MSSALALVQLRDELEPMPGPGAAVGRVALDRLLAGEARTLDQAFGLRNGAGQSWLRDFRLARRDALIRDAVRRHFPGKRGEPAAAQIAEAWKHYNRSEDCKRDRGLLVCPYQTDSREAALFALMKTGSPVLSWHTIRAILGDCETPLLPITEQSDGRDEST